MKIKKPKTEGALWKGDLLFGPIKIPVQIFRALRGPARHFRLLDKSDLSPVGYAHINKNTGRPIPWDQVVKGLEYEKDHYVLFDDKDLKEVQPKARHLVDLEQFVEMREVDPMLFEKPYLLLPQDNGLHHYTLLKEALLRKGKAALGKIFLRIKPHLMLIFPRKNLLYLELLRFPEEIRETEDWETGKSVLPFSRGGEEILSPQELEKAENLIDYLSAEWQPSQFKDTYEDDFKKIMKKKVGKISGPGPKAKA